VVIKTKSQVGILWEEYPCCFRSVLHRTWDGVTENAWDVRNAAKQQQKASDLIGD
jgi:hypothetical protein